MKTAFFTLLIHPLLFNLLDFIQRLDALVVFTLLITVFFKASIYLYGAVMGLTDLFKLKNH
ncbi:MAG: GerAB/ArcD/ProY family transporter [Bacillota bacterium]